MHKGHEDELLPRHEGGDEAEHIEDGDVSAVGCGSGPVAGAPAARGVFWDEGEEGGDQKVGDAEECEVCAASKEVG